MQVREAIRKRRSVRSYQKKEVEMEKLECVLEAARLAPSAKNLQEWRFVVVKEEKTRKALSEAANNRALVGEAPVIIACCAETDDYVMRCGQLAYPIDVAIAIDHMTLQAVEEGLGTCWIGSFHEDKVREILKIPDNIKVVELLLLGYPEPVQDKPKNRHQLQEIVMYEEWKRQ
ncbi:MAG: nitroreductase family protein [bacterium]